MVDMDLHLYHLTRMLCLMVAVVVLVDLENLADHHNMFQFPIEGTVAVVLEDNSHNSLVN